MTIRQALLKIKGTGKTISAKSIRYYAQDENTLILWVFLNSPIARRSERYKEIMSAKDWEVDRQ